MMLFEDSSVGDAFEEMRSLGLPFAEEIMRDLSEIETRKNHRTLAVWQTYNGIGLYLATKSPRFAVFAIEVDANDDIDITIMFAGHNGTPTPGWNGYNYEQLFDNVILPRCQVYF